MSRAAWRVSPLRRALQTADALGHQEASAEPRLIEMAWGEFEGQRLAELRRRLGHRIAAMEASGLDFRPPGGESPRMVQARVEGLMGELAYLGGKHVLVTHKGVIRAALALATGWDMRAKPPFRLGQSDALLLSCAPDRQPAVVARLPLSTPS